MGMITHPGHCRMAFYWSLLIPRLLLLCFSSPAALRWRDMDAVLAVRRKHAMESGEVDSGLWDKSG